MNRTQYNPNARFDFDFAVKTKTQEDSGFFIVGFASTPGLDRHGEIISEEALKKAASNLLEKPNNILFLNHNYDRPIGVIKESVYVAGGLMIKVKISNTEPTLKEQILEGLWGAFSIGGIVKEVEELTDKKDEFIGYKITEIELVEVSLVGVPANPEATLLEVISKSLVKKEDKNITEKDEESTLGGEVMKNKIKKENEEVEDVETEEEEVEVKKVEDTVDEEVKEEKAEEKEEEVEEKKEEVKEEAKEEESKEEDEESEEEVEKEFDIKEAFKALNDRLDSFASLVEDIKAIKEATVTTVKSEKLDEAEEEVEVKEESKPKRKAVIVEEKGTEEEALLKQIGEMTLKEIMETPAVWDKLDKDMQKEIKNKYVVESLVK